MSEDGASAESVVFQQHVARVFKLRACPVCGADPMTAGWFGPIRADLTDGDNPRPGPTPGTVIGIPLMGIKCDACHYVFMFAWKSILRDAAAKETTPE